MAGNSRRRKRAKQESDDDNTPQAGPSSAPVENKPSTASQTAAKRRRLDPGPSSVISSSPPAPTVAASTSTVRRRNRSRAAPAKQSTSLGRNAADEPVVKDEPLDNVGNQTALSPGDSSVQRRSPQVEPPSDTSSLSALSDHETVQAIKKEEPDVVTTAHAEPQSTARLEVGPEVTTKPVRQYTRAEKGKGRDKSPQPDQQLREEAVRLRAELAKLRGELTNANSTVEAHQSFATKVSEALTCNICLETLHLPLAWVKDHL
ncbi:hypothetical protein P389DRAFT_65754 [Cystobasidium minutum MCA 4210]|uniref:uncharacterized protein n=1 Tax=Cystobasidium minutum MCA 4210 TaxID=1397322 RepID=UPI0034CE7D83|eukprot:jgi/Rhomi1/65754/CE65753_66